MIICPELFQLHYHNCMLLTVAITVDEDEHGNSVTGEDFSDCDSPHGKGPSPTGAFASFSPMGQRSSDHPNPGSSVFSFPSSSFANNMNVSSSSSSGHSPTLSNSFSHSAEDRILPLCSAARPLRKRDLLRLLSTITPSAEVFDSDQVMCYTNVAMKTLLTQALTLLTLSHCERSTCSTTGLIYGCSSVVALPRKFATSCSTLKNPNPTLRPCATTPG